MLINFHFPEHIKNHEEDEEAKREEIRIRVDIVQKQFNWSRSQDLFVEKYNNTEKKKFERITRLQPGGEASQWTVESEIKCEKVKEI